MQNNSLQRLSIIEATSVVLVAIVAIIAVIVVWQSLETMNSVCDTDLSELRTSINMTKTTAMKQVETYESYSGYASSWLVSHLPIWINNNYNNITENINLKILIGKKQAAAVIEEIAYKNPSTQSDKWKTNSSLFFLALLTLISAPVFFLLVDSVKGKMQYVMVSLGTLFVIWGAIMTLLLS